MAFYYKLEAKVEIKASADKFYNVFRSQSHQVPNITSRIHTVDVHEGDWDSHGSVKLWKFTVDGTVETYKEKVELDDETKTVTLVGLEGDVMKHYKNYRVTFHAIPKAEGGGVVRLAIEFEKIKEDAPYPTKYLDFMIYLTKDIDAHLVKA